MKTCRNHESSSSPSIFRKSGILAVVLSMCLIGGCSSKELDVWEAKDTKFADYEISAIDKVNSLDFRLADDVGFINNKLYLETVVNKGDDMKQTRDLYTYDFGKDNLEPLPIDHSQVNRIFSIYQNKNDFLYSTLSKAEEGVYPSIKAGIWSVKDNKQTLIGNYAIDVYYRAPLLYNFKNKAYFLTHDFKTVKTEKAPFSENQDVLSFNVYQDGKVKQLFSTTAKLNENFMYEGDGEFTDFDYLYDNQKGSIGFYTGMKEKDTIKFYFYDYQAGDEKVRKTYIGKDIEIAGYQDKYVYGRNKKGLFLFNLETKHKIQLSEAENGQYSRFKTLPNNMIIYNYQTPYSLKDETYVIQLQDGYYNKMKIDIPDRNGSFPSFVSDGEQLGFFMNFKFYRLMFKEK